MSSQDLSVSQSGKPTQNGILENDNLALAANNANVSLDNAVRLADPPYQMGSAHGQHVYNLLIAYSEVDVLVKSVGAPPEVAAQAKISYTQVYNFSDFEGHLFQHGILVAACVYIACCEKNQRRTMPEVFKSSHATTQEMLNVCETLEKLFAVPPEPRLLLSEAEKRLQSACQEIISFSDSVGVPPYASQHAKRLYKKTHDSGRFINQDQKLIIASCLFIACRQLKIQRIFREIFAMLPGATKADIGTTFKSLEEFFAAEGRQETTGTPEGSVTGTSTDARSADGLVHAIQELTEQLTLEENLDSINERSTVIQASCAPTAPTPASIATTEGKDTETDNSNAPAAPFAANLAHALHDSADENTISTLPPTSPATVADRKNARATRDTPYAVICCECKKISDLQNIEYPSYCVNCKHKRCEDCTMEAISEGARAS